MALFNVKTVSRFFHHHVSPDIVAITARIKVQYLHSPPFHAFVLGHAFIFLSIRWFRSGVFHQAFVAFCSLVVPLSRCAAGGQAVPLCRRSQPWLLLAAPGQEGPRRCHGRASLRCRHRRPGSAGGALAVPRRRAAVASQPGPAARSARWEPAAAARFSPSPRTSARLPGARREGAEGTAPAALGRDPPGPSRPPSSAAQRPRCHGGSGPQGRAPSLAMAPGTLWRSRGRGRGPVANRAAGHLS